MEHFIDNIWCQLTRQQHVVCHQCYQSYYVSKKEHKNYMDHTGDPVYLCSYNCFINHMANTCNHIASVQNKRAV